MTHSKTIPHLFATLLAMLMLLALPASGFAQGGDVEVEVDQFGLQGTYRPGGVVGIRLKLTALPESSLDEATTAWVQWEVTNADGDIGEYGRAVTLTKRRPTRLWLYAPISPEADSGSVWPVRVFEFTDGERGRELGGLRVPAPPTGRIDLSQGAVAVVGRSQMGLGQLKLSPVGATGLVFTDHEDTIGLWGLRPEDLPDRWEGLLALEAIAWSGELPQDLSTAQSDALREWVRRGGHLIVSLPEDTNPWGLGEPGQTDLEDMLPTRAPRKDDDVLLSTLLPILCKSRELGETARDFSVGVRVFEDLADGFDSMSNDYEPLIALPDGRVVVVQRLFGHGRVTVIGIDLANRQLVNTHPVANSLIVGLPQADVFWSRILGRRADTPTAGELMQIQAAERLTRSAPQEQIVGGSGIMDINMSGRAGAGLLMAVLLFIAYWVVAGPGGFYALKQLKRLQHAWLFFAAAAAVFTAAAWGGVNLLRSNDTSVRHATFLDHVVPLPGRADEFGTDPQLQRAISWLSVFLPGYGSTAVSIDSEEAMGTVPQQRDLLLSWTPPREKQQTFPNADRYRVDLARQPDDFLMPSRATATRLYANWLGGLRTEWGSMLREDPADPVRVDLDARGNEVLRGSIINELPGRLEDVTVIWVWSRRIPTRRYALENGVERVWVQMPRSGQMLNVGRMWRVKGGGLDAGERYPLPDTDAESNLSNNLHRTYVREFESSNFLGTPAGSIDERRRRQFMEMLTVYRQLTPPTYLKQPKEQNPSTMSAQRLLGRELDLSAWLTRPCVIVLGFIDSPCPVPLRVDGEAVNSEGTTMVRWIRPLPVESSVAFPIRSSPAEGSR